MNLYNENDNKEAGRKNEEKNIQCELKAKIVLEVLRGEKEISAIASEYEDRTKSDTQLVSRFLKNAAAAFDVQTG
jgi:hypothetical protein